MKNLEQVEAAFHDDPWSVLNMLSSCHGDVFVSL